MKTIRVLIKKPNQPPYEEYVKDKLESFQEIVGGLIESVYIDGLSQRGIVCYCNEEGKILQLEPNFALTQDKTIYDVVCGPVVFLRDDGEGGNMSLTSKDIAIITFELKMMELMND